jgi:hypothetical protein
MKVKASTLVIYFLMAVFLLQLNTVFSQIKVKETADAPVPIFYGLNESQSNSWAQINDNGEIGVSIFYHSDYSTGHGHLLYKSIHPVNGESIDTITSGYHLELSVLVFDDQQNPHVFYGQSNSTSQIIFHCFKENNEWVIDEIYDFAGSNGKFIYELSVDKGPDGSFHLLALITRSNPDSNDYYFAFVGANLCYLTNTSGNWDFELIKVYDTYYTLDEYSKMMNRQDLKIDTDGFAHILFGEQLGNTMAGSASRLQYSTNKTGDWTYESVAEPNNSDSRDDPGWYPSLCLDNEGVPNVTCTYITRFPTGSAISAKLNLFTKTGNNQWVVQTICENDDGYYGTDGRDYTGGLTHLVFDKQNSPHVIFTDIASSHTGSNYFNLGNIRYAIKKTDTWEVSKIYQQPLPNGRYNATEMYDMCLLYDAIRNKLQVVGQEIVLQGSNDYDLNLLHFSIVDSTTSVNESIINKGFNIYPNPVGDCIYFHLNVEQGGTAQISFFNMKGECVFSVNQFLHQGVNQVKNLDEYLKPGNHIVKVDSDELNLVKQFVKL